MCCFFTVLVFLGPRFAGIIWWLIQPIRWVGETGASAFSSAIWPILGLIFLPWSTLLYVAVAPGGINGYAGCKDAHLKNVIFPSNEFRTPCRPTGNTRACTRPISILRLESTMPDSMPCQRMTRAHSATHSILGRQPFLSSIRAPDG